MEDCDKLEEVYTYDNDIGKCQKVKWRGCETYNKFDDYGTCLLVCNKFITVSNELIADEKSDGTQQEAERSDSATASPFDEYGGDQSPVSDESVEDEDENRQDENTSDSEDGTPDDDDDDGEAASE